MVFYVVRTFDFKGQRVVRGEYINADYKEAQHSVWTGRLRRSASQDTKVKFDFEKKLEKPKKEVEPKTKEKEGQSEK